MLDTFGKIRSSNYIPHLYLSPIFPFSGFEPWSSYIYLSYSYHVHFLQININLLIGTGPTSHVSQSVALITIILHLRVKGEQKVNRKTKRHVLDWKRNCGEKEGRGKWDQWVLRINLSYCWLELMRSWNENERTIQDSDKHIVSALKFQPDEGNWEIKVGQNTDISIFVTGSNAFDLLVAWLH